MFYHMEKLYTIKSQAVHGGKIKDPSNSVKKSVRIPRRWVLKCAENGGLPETDDLAP